MNGRATEFLIIYLGFYLVALMSTYLLYSLNWITLSVSSLFVFTSLALIFSFLLICTTHEMGHCVALKCRKYRVSSISVLLWILPHRVNNQIDPTKREDAKLLCLSGPLTGVFTSLILGFLFWLVIPLPITLAIILVLVVFVVPAFGLGWLDYVGLKSILRQ